MPVLREALLTMSRNSQLKDLVTRLPVSSGLVSRFVAGEDTDDAVRVARSLVEQGLKVTLDHLGEDTTDIEHAAAVDRRLPHRARPARRRRPDERHRGVGQALRGRPGAARRRREDRARQRAADLRGRPDRRHHRHPRHGGPHHHRLDAGILREVRRDFPTPARCCSPTCGAPSPTAASSWRTKAPGSGSARAPTTSPTPSPSAPRATSTSRTCAASRCSCRAPATR